MYAVGFTAGSLIEVCKRGSKFKVGSDKELTKFRRWQNIIEGGWRSRLQVAGLYKRMESISRIYTSECRDKNDR